MSRSLRRRLAAQTANGTLKRIRAVSRDKYTDYFTKYGVLFRNLTSLSRPAAARSITLGVLFSSGVEYRPFLRRREQTPSAHSIRNSRVRPPQPNEGMKLAESGENTAKGRKAPKQPPYGGPRARPRPASSARTAHYRVAPPRRSIKFALTDRYIYVNVAPRPRSCGS